MNWRAIWVGFKDTWLTNEVFRNQVSGVVLGIFWILFTFIAAGMIDGYEGYFVKLMFMFIMSVFGFGLSIALAVFVNMAVTSLRKSIPSLLRKLENRGKTIT